MDGGRQEHGVGGHAFPPATVLLEDRSAHGEKLILHPTPSDDPNDPLNWSTLRKSVHFGLASSCILSTFVMLGIIGIGLHDYIHDLGLSYEIFNISIAMNYAGLALGCIFFMPFVHKYGRRPFYIVSSVIQLVAAIWSAALHTGGELTAVNFVSGIGGAISESIVLITIVDLFFLHQHARMNGLFLMVQSIGAFGGKVAAEFIAESMGWQWILRWIAISLGASLVMVLLFFEKTKYIPNLAGRQTRRRIYLAHENHGTTLNSDGSSHPIDENPTKHDGENQTIQLKPYSQRLAFYTKTPTPVYHHF